MIRVGVIGYGYWGPSVVRNFIEADGLEPTVVADIDAPRRELVSLRYPGIATTGDYRSVLRDPSIDAVAIVTGAASHYEIALEALRAGKHVWIEKPLTQTSQQGARLIDEAAKRRRTLFVDHTFVYTGAVRKMREITHSGRLGTLFYYDSMRANLGLHRADVNVLWDLAVHDLSIMEYTLGQHPTAVSAIVCNHHRSMPEDMGYLTCFYPGDLVAHINVSWLTPTKVRRTFVGGDRQMLMYDDTEPEEKIRVYDRSVKLGGSDGAKQRVTGYKRQDTWAPALDTAEALKSAAGEFVRAIETDSAPITDGCFGLRIVRILEAAVASAKLRGTCIEIGDN